MLFSISFRLPCVNQKTFTAPVFTGIFGFGTKISLSIYFDSDLLFPCFGCIVVSMHNLEDGRLNLAGHIMIASKTYNLLEKEYGINIDRAAFIAGNVLPDTSFRMKRPVHRIENWGERVNELIHELETKDFESNRRFSLHLGIVCHFVSDFFCLAHNDPYYMKQLVHFVYETRQTSKFYRLRKKKYNLFDPLFDIPADIGTSSYLAQCHSDFFSNEISFEKELTYSVEVCTALCSMMVAVGVLVPTV